MTGTKIRTGFSVLNQGVTQFCSSVPSKMQMGSGFWKKWAPFALFTESKKQKRFWRHFIKSAGTLEHTPIYNNNNNIIYIQNKDLRNSKNLFQVLFVKLTPSERWNTFIINNLQGKKQGISTKSPKTTI